MLKLLVLSICFAASSLLAVDADSVLYENKDFHYELSLPKGFKVETIPGNLAKIFIRINDLQKKYACIQLAVSEEKKDIDAKTHIMISSSLFKQNYPKAEITDNGLIKINEQNMYSFVVDFEAHGLKYKQKMVYYFYDGKIYTFAFAGTESNFNEFEPQFQKIIESFRTLK